MALFPEPKKRKGLSITTLGASKPKLSDVQSTALSNERNRALLAAAGQPDPTKEKKAGVLEQLFGILDTPGAGVRAGVYNLLNDPSDADVSILGEMGKALKGEQRIEGADILKSVGVDNKWGQMLGGFVVDIALDPLTYLSFGFSSATKQAGKTALTAIAQYGDNVDDVARALGKTADEVAPLVSKLKAAGHFDEAGKLRALTLAESMPDEAAKLSRSLMTDIYSEFGKGGVKFAGIGTGTERGVAELGYKAKAAARTLPGSKWVEQAFTMGDLPSDAVRLFREGNEAVNAVVKTLRRNAQGRVVWAEELGARFGQAIQDALPNEQARMQLTKALGESFTDELPEITDAMKVLASEADDAAKDAARLKLINANKRAYTNTSERVANALLDAGFDDETVENAVGVADMFKQRFDDLLARQQAAGIDAKPLLGVDATGYIPGMVPKRQGKDLRSLEDFISSQFGVDDLTMPDKPTNGFLRQKGYTPTEGRPKTYLTPNERVQGIQRSEMGLDELVAQDMPHLSTEFDLARIGAAAASGQERNVALAEFGQQVTDALGGGEGAQTLAETIVKGIDNTFTNDEATKGFLRLYDKTLNLWKKAATVWRFPAFPERNFLSNKVLMLQDGVLSELGERESMSLMTRLATKSLSEADQSLLDEALQHGVWTKAADLAELVGGGTTGKNPVTDLFSSVNEFVENQSRLSAYITAKGKGLDPQAAAQMVDQSLFNYSRQAYSVIENEVIMRLVPFYKFMKQNLTKQTRLLLTRPGAVTWTGHLKESGEATNPVNLDVMPEWLKEVSPIPLPLRSKEGNVITLATEGVLPTADLEIVARALTNPSDMPRELFSRLNPLIKTPIEQLLNSDSYYQDPIERYKGEKRRAPGYIEVFDDLVASVPGLSDVWEVVKDSAGIEERTDEDSGSPYLYMPARSLKWLKDLVPWMNTIGKSLQESPKQTYDIFSQFTGLKAVMFDEESFGEQKVYNDQYQLQEAVRAARDSALIPKSSKKKVSLSDMFGGGK